MIVIRTMQHKVLAARLLIPSSRFRLDVLLPILRGCQRLLLDTSSDLDLLARVERCLFLAHPTASVQVAQRRAFVMLATAKAAVAARYFAISVPQGNIKQVQVNQAATHVLLTANLQVAPRRAFVILATAKAAVAARYFAISVHRALFLLLLLQQFARLVPLAKHRAVALFLVPHVQATLTVKELLATCFMMATPS